MAKPTLTLTDRPELPSRTTVSDCLDWWYAFLDGKNPADIAEATRKTGTRRDEATIWKGIEYIASRIGVASAPIEAVRIIEHHHRQLQILNEDLAASRTLVREIAAAMRSVAGDESVDLLPDKSFALWQELASQRRAETAVQVKLYAEIRQTARALEDIYQLKQITAELARPAASDDDGRSPLDDLSPAALRRLEREIEREVIDA